MFKATFYRQPFMSIDIGKRGMQQAASTRILVELPDVGWTVAAGRGSRSAKGEAEAFRATVQHEREARSRAEIAVLSAQAEASAQRERAARALRCRRARIECFKGGRSCSLFTDRHPLHGRGFSALGTITPLVEPWLDEGRLPSYMRVVPKAR
jgi:hypothetical protein